ncbi:MAG: hypothetical protein HY055_02040 [Magnetospirillum sp.]|nr:hypothetical protein [Magnetospirillum sp.]
MMMRLSNMGGGMSLSDEILDELEGEALVVLEHPDRYAGMTVSMARNALEMIARLRGLRHGGLLAQST